MLIARGIPIKCIEVFSILCFVMSVIMSPNSNTRTVKPQFSVITNISPIQNFVCMGAIFGKYCRPSLTVFFPFNVCIYVKLTENTLFFYEIYQ